MPMVAYGTAKTLAAFKLLSRARALDFDTSNAISKQIQNYEADVKHAKENNEDDPDYNVDEDVHIEDYVEEKYLGLIEDSKQYKGIITSIACHPCAHLVYHEDLRREIGVIRVKSKSGNKEPIQAAYIDGSFADKYGYCKSDLLRVDVVKIINDTFTRINQPVLTADELVEKTKDDPEVWRILEKGYTIGCNQTEKEKTTQRVMTFKPKNTVELSAFIAAIRPGAKSLVDYLVNRTPHTYGIPAMDKLLRLDGATGVTGESSFLLFDEQIMKLAAAAGIAPEDTNALIKHIKKKHHDEVAAFKDKFIPGFIKYLTEEEGVDQEKAQATAKNVWSVILSSASYLFNLSHAYAMGLDCLYGMYLKAHYPYEFYATLLALYDEKKNKDKVAQIIAEMKRYKGITLLPGRFGQDNRDWFVDKEHATISQSISSIRYMSKDAAEDLYRLGQQEEAEMGVITTPAVLKPDIKKEINAIKRKLKKLKEVYDTEELQAMSDQELEELREAKESAVAEGTELEQKMSKILAAPESYESEATEEHVMAKLDCFTNVLRALQMNTGVNTRVIKLLIGIGYFSAFGKTGKLTKIFDEFFEGPQALTKTIKSFQKRLDYMRQYESSLPDEDLPIALRLQLEYENIGLCISVDPTGPYNRYFIENVEDKYSVKAKLYSVQRGTTGIIRISKKQQEKDPLQAGLCLRMIEFKKRQRCSYKNGQRTPIPGETDCWVTQYTLEHSVA